MISDSRRTVDAVIAEMRIATKASDLIMLGRELDRLTIADEKAAIASQKTARDNAAAALGAALKEAMEHLDLEEIEVLGTVRREADGKMVIQAVTARPPVSWTTLLGEAVDFDSVPPSVNSIKFSSIDGVELAVKGQSAKASKGTTSTTRGAKGKGWLSTDKSPIQAGELHRLGNLFDAYATEDDKAAVEAALSDGAVYGIKVSVAKRMGFKLNA